jgi:hypothetical protein
MQNCKTVETKGKKKAKSNAENLERKLYDQKIILPRKKRKIGREQGGKFFLKESFCSTYTGRMCLPRKKY